MTSSVARLGRRYPVLSGIVGLVVLGQLSLSSPASAQEPMIVQTNSAGDNVHLIDPTTNTIVGEITGVEVVHGVARCTRWESLVSHQRVDRDA